MPYRARRRGVVDVELAFDAKRDIILGVDVGVEYAGTRRASVTSDRCENDATDLYP
jgi:hypothetical protein